MQLPNESLVGWNTTLVGFENKLRGSSLSQKTIRNYLSDLSHFSSWTATLVGTANFVPYLTGTIIEKYKESMIQTATPARTINRKLSTVRLFGKYLHEERFLPTNPSENLTNLEVSSGDTHEQLLAEFKKHLEEQKVSDKTMSNYLSDVRSFLRFAGQA